MDATPLSELLARLQAGDDAAATAIFRRYAGRLLGLAHSRLDAHLRQKMDPEDVVQSVFRSFFQRQAAGQFTFKDWDDLWALLVVFTVRKCLGKADFYHAACRDTRREEGASDDPQGAASWQALAREPTPDEVLALGDLVEQLFAGFDPREQQILSLCLQDWTAVEVKAELGCSERTVYRIQERARKRLKRLIGLEGDRP